MLHKSRPRKGTATVELALLAPFLALMFVLAIDYSRLFYFTQTLVNCARNGALFASDSYDATRSPYANVTEAARADAPEFMRDRLTVESSTVSGTDDAYVKVTVSYTFTTITDYPLIPTTMTLQRSVQMRVNPLVPK